MNNTDIQLIKTDWKDKIQYGTAVASFLAGVGMGFLSFISHGTIKSEVLMFIGECLILTASIFGVTMYVRTKFGEIKNFILDQQTNDNNHTIKIVGESKET